VIYDAKDDLDYQPAEIVVGTGKLTAIFLASAVVCGACFGFGYSLGRHSAAKAAEAVAVPSNPPTTSATAANKPLPGSTQDAADSSHTREEVVIAPSSQPAPVAKSVPASAPDVTSSHSDANSATANNFYVVQIAAVSRPKDADILVAALQRKGYNVSAIASSQDHLVHVQVGPFSNAQDAHAMQDSLSNDGYLAIVK